MSFIEWLFGEHRRWPRINLRTLNHKLDIIMATQNDLVTKITAATTQLQKISTESTATLAKVTELQAIIDGMDEVTPELQAAVDALAAQIQAVDDLTPDIIPPVEPPTDPTARNNA